MDDQADQVEQEQKEERRPTVIVTCAVVNGVQIRRHTAGLEDKAPMLPTGQGYELKQGDTAGIDKEWFLAWLEENKSLSLVTTGQISWRDEPEPEDVEQEDERVAQLADDDGGNSNDDQADKPPAAPQQGITDGPGNPVPKDTTNQGA